MNSNQQDLTQFNDLIAELENQDNRPYAPNLPTETKNNLRRDLLNKHQSTGLSRHAVGKLWKFSGTAVAAFLFIFFIAGLIAILSNPSTQTNSPQVVKTVSPTRTPNTQSVVDAPSDQLPIPSGLSSFAAPNDLSQEAIAIGNRIQLLSYEVVATERGSTLQLRWLPTAIVDEKFQLFVHLFDDQESLVFQANNVLSDNMPLMGNESQEPVEVTIDIPTHEMFNGSYDISLGLYNSETGERLPVSAMNTQFVADDETAVWLTDGLFIDNENEPTIAQSNSGGGGGGNRETTIQFGESLLLTAYETQQDAEQMSLSFDWLPLQTSLPDYTLSVQIVNQDGEQIEQIDSPILQDGLPSSQWVANGIVHTEQTISLTELPNSRYNLLISVNDTSTGEPLLAASSNSQLLNDEETAVRLLTWNTQTVKDRVWLISATQKERPSTDAPIEIEYTLGYQFESDEEVLIKMSYGDANWESMDGNGRLPIDSLDNPIFLETNQGEFTITTTINPREAKQITGTDNPVLIAEMGYIIPHDDERGNEFVFLARETFSDYPLDLTDIAEIVHTPTQINTLCQAVVNGTSGNGLVLRDAPNGSLIDVLFDGALVQLISDGEPQIVNGLVRRKVHVLATGDDGWIAENYLDYQPSPESTNNITCPPDAQKGFDSIEIVNVSPAPGSTLSGTTSFQVEISYTLSSLPEAQILVGMMPTNEAPANMGEVSEIVSQGNGTSILNFDFIPEETGTPSNWNMVIWLLSTDVAHLGEALSAPLATTTAYKRGPENPYRYQP